MCQNTLKYTCVACIFLGCSRSFLIAYFSGPQSLGTYRDLIFFQFFSKLINVYCGNKCFNICCAPRNKVCCRNWTFLTFVVRIELLLSRINIHCIGVACPEGIERKDTSLRRAIYLFCGERNILIYTNM